MGGGPLISLILILILTGLGPISPRNALRPLRPSPSIPSSPHRASQNFLTNTWNEQGNSTLAPKPVPISIASLTLNLKRELRSPGGLCCNQVAGPHPRAPEPQVCGGAGEFAFPAGSPGPARPVLPLPEYVLKASPRPAGLMLSGSYLTSRCGDARLLYPQHHQAAHAVSAS
ncbi:hypothetical protein VULLAG_LOCUS18050 [Vulpes lagopus]